MYVITDKCVSCGTCASVCPCEAITEGADHYEINQDLCAQCGTCAANCPLYMDAKPSRAKVARV